MKPSGIPGRPGRTRCVLLALYTLFVLFTFAVLKVPSAQYLPKWFLLIAAVCAVLCPLLLRRAGQLRLDAPAADGASSRKWAVIFFAVPLICFLFKYIVYWPGAFLADSMVQYGQAVTGEYDNWHPVIHTLLFFRLPLLLSGGWNGSIVLFQIILFSLALSCAFTTLRRIAGERFALVSLAFVLLNPETTNLAVFPVKDTAFGIGVLVLVSFTLRIFFSRGEWIRKPLNLLAFAAVLALTALVRHNGVLFAVPLLFALCLLIPWKRFLALVACFAVLFCGIRFPLYSALKAETKASPAFETLGVPLAVILGCAKYAPETLDAETARFVGDLIPAEVLDATEPLQDFNAIKYNPETNIPLIGEYGAGRIIPMAARCFVHAPLVSFRILIGITDVVYTLTDDYNYCDYPRTSGNEYGLGMQGIPALQNLCNKLSGVLNLTLPWLFMYVGAMHFVLLVLILAKCSLRTKNGWRKILVVLPVFVYNGGTALLLSGLKDSSRYFAYTFWLMPFLAALLLREEIRENT